MKQQTTIQISGSKDMVAQEQSLVRKLAEKTMEKISKMSDYNKLRISFKSHGNTKNTSQKKLSMNILVSRGNKVLHMRKEIAQGTSDELTNDRVNAKNWNVIKSLQEAFRSLEERVKGEQGRKSWY